MVAQRFPSLFDELAGFGCQRFAVPPREWIAIRILTDVDRGPVAGERQDELAGMSVHDGLELRRTFGSGKRERADASPGDRLQSDTLDVGKQDEGKLGVIGSRLGDEILKVDRVVQVVSLEPDQWT